MARSAFPAPIRGGGRPLLPASRRTLVAAALIVMFAIAALLGARWASRGEAQLEQLPEDQRRALYGRTLADLELCSSAAGTALVQHCANQADFILTFPECEASCKELARAWQTTPTR